MDDRLTVVLTSDAGTDDSGGLDRLAGLVEAFVAQARLPADLAFRLNLCIDELVTNTRAYGLPAGGAPNGRAPAFRVDVALVDGAIRARIEDDTEAYDPFANAPSPNLEAAVENRPIGGLGLHLLRRFADDLSYSRDGGRNVVTLTLRNS